MSEEKSKSLFSAQEAAWIMRGNSEAPERRRLSQEELDDVLVSDDPPFSVRSKAEWVRDLGKNLEAKERARNTAMASEKISRGEMVMALMGFCSIETYNQLMVYTMAFMKALEVKGLITKQEIQEQIRSFSKPEPKEGSAENILQTIEETVKMEDELKESEPPYGLEPKPEEAKEEAAVEPEAEIPPKENLN